MKKYVISALLLAPLMAIADEARDDRRRTENIYTAAAMCDLTPNEMLSSFIGGGLVVAKPVVVSDSVSFFRPHLLKKIYIENMRVSLVFGYLRDQIAFQTSARHPPYELYGFVVNVGIADAQAQLNSIGSTAKTRLTADGKTSIICIGE